MEALADTYSQKSAELPSEEQLQEVLQTATTSLRGRVPLPDDLSLLVDDFQVRVRRSTSTIETDRRTVARWFEIALDEFDQVPMSALQPRTFFEHAFFERSISEWFKDWGYEVEQGEELEGLEGTDFIPDVYATLETLHGTFQVAVTLFCSNPPSTWRVLAMLENIEAFAPKGSEFGERDIYLLVTPYKFLEQGN